MTADIRQSQPFQILPILAAALYGVLIATGALTLVLVIAAAMSGGSVADLFADVFPRFRGGTNTTRIPGLGYAIFIIYTVAASTIAVVSRRRFANRWSGK